MIAASDKIRASDKFLLPQETTFRFYAMIVALMGGLAFMWSWLFLSLPYTRHVAAPALAICINSALAQHDNPKHGRNTA